MPGSAITNQLMFDVQLRFLDLASITNSIADTIAKAISDGVDKAQEKLKHIREMMTPEPGKALPGTATTGALAEDAREKAAAKAKEQLEKAREGTIGQALGMITKIGPRLLVVLTAIQGITWFILKFIEKLQGRFEEYATFRRQFALTRERTLGLQDIITRSVSGENGYLITRKQVTDMIKSSSDEFVGMINNLQSLKQVQSAESTQLDLLKDKTAAFLGALTKIKEAGGSASDMILSLSSTLIRRFSLMQDKTLENATAMAENLEIAFRGLSKKDAQDMAETVDKFIHTELMAGRLDPEAVRLMSENVKNATLYMKSLGLQEGGGKAIAGALKAYLTGEGAMLPFGQILAEALRNTEGNEEQRRLAVMQGTQKFMSGIGERLQQTISGLQDKSFASQAEAFEKILKPYGFSSKETYNLLTAYRKMGDVNISDPKVFQKMIDDASITELLSETIDPLTKISRKLDQFYESVVNEFFPDVLGFFDVFNVFNKLFAPSLYSRTQEKIRRQAEFEMKRYEEGDFSSLYRMRKALENGEDISGNRLTEGTRKSLEDRIEQFNKDNSKMIESEISALRSQNTLEAYTKDILKRYPDLDVSQAGELANTKRALILRNFLKMTGAKEESYPEEAKNLYTENYIKEIISGFPYKEDPSNTIKELSKLMSERDDGFFKTEEIKQAIMYLKEISINSSGTTKSVDASKNEITGLRSDMKTSDHGLKGAVLKNLWYQFLIGTPN